MIEKLARELIHGAEKVIIFAGAGIGVELGTPVYWTGENNRYGGERSRFGFTDLEHAHADLWNKKRMEQLMFYSEKWSQMLSQNLDGENSPYELLLNFLTKNNKDYFVVTSNVDTAFARFGFKGDSIYEIHGAYDRVQCLQVPHHGVFPRLKPETGFTLCPKCGSHTRPNVLFFNDPFFNSNYNNLQEDAWDDFLENINRDDPKTVLIEIGAGLTVPNLRNRTKKLNSGLRVPVIRINLHQTEMGDHEPYDVSVPIVELPMTASDGLRSILV